MATEPGSVWIVVQEDVEDNQILGVFASAAEADNFMESQAEQFPAGTFSYGEYAIGWHR